MMQPPFFLAMAGLGSSWYLYMKRPDIPEMLKEKFGMIYTILDNKYGFDDFNQKVFAGGSRKLGSLLWNIGDIKIIDGTMVNGTAKAIGWFSGKVRVVQTGYLYHYAFVMIIGLLGLVSYVTIF
jgi:NADH-quinone oxidoreductase subunit L